MYILGHVGLGPWLLTPVFRRLMLGHTIPAPRQTSYYLWLLVGCLLPDLLDKPLHFLVVHSELRLPMILGDKGFGHTIVFALSLITLSVWRKNLIGQLLGLGILTHLFLDLLADSTNWWWFGTQAYPLAPYHPSSPKLAAYFWPFWTVDFSPSSQKTVLDYWGGLVSPPLLLWELLGLLLFNWTRKQFSVYPKTFFVAVLDFFKR